MNCRVCGSPLPEGALFCGECGSAVNATPVTRAAAADSRASDTTIIERLPRPATAGPAIVSREILFDMPQPASGGPGATDAAPDTVLRSTADREAVHRDAVERDAPVARPGEEPLRRDAVAGRDVAGRDVRAGRGAVARDTVAAPDAVERDAPAPVGPEAAQPFVLTFSTGDVASVTGAGLLGRRPIAQPGESVPQVVQISDPERSVSKTHLEFGLEAGELWICDRYSGNGTVIYPPGARPRRCEPGRRYRVTRGSRVEIGDQYFDVS